MGTRETLGSMAHDRRYETDDGPVPIAPMTQAELFQKYAEVAIGYHQKLPKMEERFKRYVHDAIADLRTELLVAFANVSRPSSVPPRSRFNPSDSQQHMIVGGHPVPIAVYQEIVMTADHAEAETFRKMKRGTFAFIGKVAAMVVTALIVGYLAGHGFHVLP